MISYYELSDNPYIPGRWHLCAPINDEGCDPSDFTSGKPARVRSIPNVDIQIPGIMLDFTLTSFDVPIATHALAEAFGKVAVEALQRIPVTVGGRSGYEILNATRRIRCLDEQRSEFIKWTAFDERPDRINQYRMVTKLHINKALVPFDTHIFRIDGWDVALIVSSKLVDIVRSTGATGLAFHPVG
jgi:hypothetical protein